MSKRGRKKSEWEDFKSIYEEVKERYNLSGTNEEQMNALIKAGDDIQTDICQESDYIKNDGHETAASLIGVNISSKDWKDMVAIGVKSESKNTDKLISKIEADIDKSNYMNNINNSLKNNVSSGKSVSNIQLPIDETSYISPGKTESIPELNTLFENCINTRNHINSVLYKEYNNLAKAFIYLSEGKCSRNDFKTLVDDVHYKDGGYPSEKTPPRTWSKINSFRSLIDAMYNGNKKEYINNYLAQFGLKVELIGNNIYSDGWH